VISALFHFFVIQVPIARYAICLVCGIVLVILAPTLAISALVTMKIRRVCANPRMLECAYSEGGIERWMLVRVKKNANFKCGMELEARRPLRETEPWEYAGTLPRIAWRW